MTFYKLIIYILIFIAAFISCIWHIFLDFRYHSKLHNDTFIPSKIDIKAIRSELFWAGWMWILLLILFLLREINGWINCSL